MQIEDHQIPPRIDIAARTLSQLILDDLFKDLVASRRWIRKLLETLTRPSVYHFAEIVSQFEEIVSCSGFRDAMRQMVSNFTSEIHQTGCENVPEQGPLLVLSNHPGTCDSLVIASSLPRSDLKIIAAGFPVLRMLPNTSQHLFFTDHPAAPSSNLSVVRGAIRHLQSGGAVLLFPSGRVDPDPAVISGAVEALHAWSPSIEVFLRKVPQTRVQFIAVSGVLVSSFLRHPLVKLLKGSRSPQAIAGAIQTVTQMLFTGWVRLKPAISFGVPKTVDELKQINESLYHAMIAEASQLITVHVQGNNIYSIK